MAEQFLASSRGIFISYRRDDAIAHVNGLFLPLREHFGRERVFKDTDNIPPGKDFRKVIETQLQSCSVLLAVIGKNWLTAAKPRSNIRRLDDANDYLRVEVATALKNDTVLVIPILVGQATMPAPEDLPADLTQLSYLNAFELRDSRWESDIKLLIEAIERAEQEPRSATAIPAVEVSDVHVDRPPVREEPPPEVPHVDDDFELLELRRKRQIAEHMKAAREAFAAKDYEAVLDACERAIWLDPQQAEARDLRRRARTALDEDKIAAWLSQAQEVIGRGDLTDADLAGASGLIDQALALNPTHALAVQRRQELLAIRKQRERQREIDRQVQTALTRAQASIDEEDFDAAIEYCDDALLLVAESAPARELRGKAVAAKNERRRQRELNRRAQRAVEQARVEFGGGQHDAAIARLERFGESHDLVANALTEFRAKLQALIKAREEQAAREAAERAAREAAEREAREAAEREARAAAERAARETAERAAREAADREAREVAAREAAAREAAERAAREAAERAAREMAEREAREAAAREVAAREAAARQQAAREAAAREAAAREEQRRQQEEQRRRQEEERRHREEQERRERKAEEQRQREAQERRQRELEAERARQAADDARRRVAAVAVEAPATPREAPQPRHDVSIATVTSIPAALQRRGHGPLRVIAAVAATLVIVIVGWFAVRPASGPENSADGSSIVAQRPQESPRDAAPTAPASAPPAAAPAPTTPSNTVEPRNPPRTEPSKAEPPPVTPPVGENPALAQLAQLRARARTQYQAGQRAQALDTVAAALKLDPKDAESLRTLRTLDTDAQTTLQNAKRNATSAQASSRAAADWQRAAARENEGATLRKRNRPDEAIRALWAAAENYTAAAQRASQAAALETTAARARNHLQAGQRTQALDAVLEGLTIDASYAPLQDVMNALWRDAHAGVERSKKQAASRGGAASASSEFEQAVRREAEAAKLREARNTADAVRALLAADDLFTKASQRAAAAAAAPPPPAPAPERPAPDRPAPDRTAESRPADAVKPPPRGRTEEEAVLQVLEDYRQAYERMDAPAVSRLQPSLSQSQMAKLFGDYHTYAMSIANPQVKIDGSTAIVTCTITTNIRPRVGEPQTFTRRTTLRLQKAGDSWIVAERR